jgi:hypothetical protein
MIVLLTSASMKAIQAWFRSNFTNMYCADSSTGSTWHTVCPSSSPLLCSPTTASSSLHHRLSPRSKPTPCSRPLRRPAGSAAHPLTTPVLMLLLPRAQRRQPLQPPHSQPPPPPRARAHPCPRPRLRLLRTRLLHHVRRRIRGLPLPRLHRLRRASCSRMVQPRPGSWQLRQGMLEVPP